MVEELFVVVIELSDEKERWKVIDMGQMGHIDVHLLGKDLLDRWLGMGQLGEKDIDLSNDLVSER